MAASRKIALLLGAAVVAWDVAAAADPPERVESEARAPEEGPRRVAPGEGSGEAPGPRQVGRGADGTAPPSPEVRRAIERGRRLGEQSSEALRQVTALLDQLPTDARRAARSSGDAQAGRALDALHHLQRSVEALAEPGEGRPSPARPNGQDASRAGGGAEPEPAHGERSDEAVELERRARRLVGGLLGDATQVMTSLPSSPHDRTGSGGRAASERAQRDVAELVRLLEEAAPVQAR